MTGWIRLHRKMLYHGHLSMPSKTLKLWIFFLLKATPWTETRKDLEVGELWTSYQEIRDVLIENDKKMSEHTISKALNYLQKHEYIDLEVKSYYGIRVKVLNWEKYQNSEHRKPAPTTTETAVETAIESAVGSAAEGAINTAIETAVTRAKKTCSGATFGPPKNTKNIKNKTTGGANKTETLLEAWKRRFYQKFKTQPQINRARDAALFKEILQYREQAEVLELIELFFTSPDPWIKDSGYTVGVFKSQLNKLLAQREQQKARYRDNKEYMDQLAREYL